MNSITNEDRLIVQGLPYLFKKLNYGNVKLSQNQSHFRLTLLSTLASERIVIGQDYSIEIAKKDGAQLIALTVNRISVSSYGLTTPQGELKQPKQKERRNAGIQAMVG